MKGPAVLDRKGPAERCRDGGALFSGASHGGALFSGASHGGPCSAVLLTAGPCSAVLLTAGPVQRCLSCVPREPDLGNHSRSVAIRPIACGALLCWTPGNVGVLRHTPNGAGGALLGSSPAAGLVRPAALAPLGRISGALASLCGWAR
ncbi:hypothetical protein NDU88_005626 [Pleurodeles waltl]|uniref:Uncharacterized protein n=1 Tax=Pleurodeles waltl TaxID=8319 RepID=A0AAV7SMB4_PLEWA|nr:hypothetical protein NDU88_005626 [Pleurodeles waltl]